MSDTKTIHLALQGGGAHGAFTWGVLDALLMDGRLRFAGISGTSAGAVNAVALAHGWAKALDEGTDPAEGARVALAHVWRKVMDMGALSGSASRMARLVMGALPNAFSRSAMARMGVMPMPPAISTWRGADSSRRNRFFGPAR